MPFQLVRLLSRVDQSDPTNADVFALLGSNTAFAVEGEEGASTASFQVEVQGTEYYAQVEGLTDHDQYVLTEPSKGEAPVRFVTECGDVYRYAAFCLVRRDMVEQALRYFLETGRRAPDLSWESTSLLLRNAKIEFE